MSMMGYLAALTSDQIAVFRERPPLASTFAQTTTDDLLQARLRASLARIPPEQRQQYAEARRELMAKMAEDPANAARTARLNALRPQVADAGPYRPVLELKQSWKLLNFLITGHDDGAPAPGDALVSGTPLGDDLGYGPPMLDDPAKARAFRDFLGPITPERLAARIDFDRIARLRIYPVYTPLDDANAEAWRKELPQTYARLKSYVAEAVDRGDGILVWLL